MSALARPTAKSSALSCTRSVQKRFIAPITLSRSRSRSACTERNPAIGVRG